MPNQPMPASVGYVHPAAIAASYALAAGTHAHPPPPLYYVPAPAKYSIVYDGGQPPEQQPGNWRSVGQYADPNTNTVHTTKGYSKRLIAQDVGQLLAEQSLSPGDRIYFSRLLGTDPARWTNLHGAQPGGGNTGDEAFSSYYAIAATGGMKPNESITWGETPIDPKTLKKYTAALQRLGRRHGLQQYTP